MFAILGSLGKIIVPVIRPAIGHAIGHVVSILTHRVP